MEKEILVKDLMSTPLFSIRSDQIVQDAQKKMKGYLLSWDEIPGNDNEKLIEFLKQNYDINIKTENIEKIDDGKIIRASSEENSLSLILNDEKTKVDLQIDKNKPTELSAKMENGKLDIYMNNIDLKKITIVDTKGDLIGITDSWRLKLVDSDVKIYEAINDKPHICSTVSTVPMDKRIDEVAPILQEKDFLVVIDDHGENIGAISRIDLRKLEGLIWPFVLKTTSWFMKERQKEIWKQLPHFKGRKIYHIRACIDSDVSGALERVDRVEYHLSPTYRERQIQIKSDYKDKFLLKELAYGEYTLIAKVFLKGKEEPIELQQWVKLQEGGAHIC